MAQTAEEITINKKNDEFFIALGKTGIHSFVMLGVIQHGKPTLLAKIGKSNSIDKDFGSQVKMFAKNIITHTEAELQSESLQTRGHISYSAYTINYEQYLQFINLLSIAQRINPIHCYQPPTQEDNDTIIMTVKPVPKKSLETASKDKQAIVDRSHAISVGNTCRDTAIELIEYTQGIPHLLDNVVPRSFFRSLPLSANFSYGKPDKYFYVFPLPPSAYKTDPDKNKTLILTKIYQRMENLLKKDTYGKNTIQKFEALKILYNQQAGISNHSIGNALESIRQWKEENKTTISQLRDQSFFGRLFVSTSSTKKMADEIEDFLTQRSTDPTQTLL